MVPNSVKEMHMLQNSWVRSLGVVAAGVAVALVVYGLLRLAGVDMWYDKDDQNPIGVADVIVASLVGGLAAWAVNALLIRIGHPRWWPFVGSTALAISMLGPSYMSDGSSAMALMCLHFAVAIVLIWGFAKTGPAYWTPPEERTPAGFGTTRAERDPMRG
jgi:hypothetical protein